MFEDREYLIKQKKGLLWRFTYEEIDGVVYQNFENNRWTDKTIIYKNAMKNFFVNLAQDDRIFLFCQNSYGNIILCLYDNGKWSEQVLLNSKKSMEEFVHFNVLVYKEDIHIIYSIRDENRNVNTLCQITSYGKQYWSAPRVIDSNVAQSNNCSFFVEIDSRGNMVVFYLGNHIEKEIGYRKYSVESNLWSDFYVVDRSSNGFEDQTAIINKGYFHVLYVKNDRYVSTLCYRRRDAKWKKPIELFKDQWVRCCNLFMIDEQLWCVWISENKVYSAFSLDNGESFSTPEVESGIDARFAKKIFYLTNQTEEVKHLVAKEVIEKDREELDFAVISRIFPFINKGGIEEGNIDSFIADDSDCNLEYIRMHIREVYEKIYLYRKQISEKENQISQLNFLLQNKNNEISKTNYLLQESRKENEKLLSENRKLLEKTNSLEGKLVPKEKEINVLVNKSSNQEKELVALSKEMDHLKSELYTIKSSYLSNSQVERKKKSSILRQFFGEDDN